MCELAIDIKTGVNIGHTLSNYILTLLKIEGGKPVINNNKQEPAC